MAEQKRPTQTRHLSLMRRRRARIMKYLTECRHDYYPSTRDIMEHVQAGSTAVICDDLDALEKMGYIRKPHGRPTRSYQVLVTFVTSDDATITRERVK